MSQQPNNGGSNGLSGFGQNALYSSTFGSQSLVGQGNLIQQALAQQALAQQALALHNAALYGIGTYVSTSTFTPTHGFGALGVGTAALTGPLLYVGEPEVEHEGIRAGEILAWRAWKINRQGFLTSVSANRVWAPGEPMAAETLSGDLGIHAFKEQSRVLEFVQSYGSDVFAVGTVELWGEVIEHEIGYRAEFAEVKSVDYLLASTWNWRTRTQLRRLQSLYAGGGGAGKGGGMNRLYEDEEFSRIVEIHYRQQERSRASKIERKTWVWAARKLFEPGRKESCWVCGKFASIVEAHHVIPLEMQYERGFLRPDNEYVWLCPNHHTIAHCFVLDGPRRKFRDVVVHDLSEEELNKVIELMRRSGRGPRE